MSTVDHILSEIDALPYADQQQILRRLSQTVLAKRFLDRSREPDVPLPVSDEELDQIVHEAREEMLRSRGLL